MRTLFVRLLDYWGELTVWNQFGLAFIAAVGLLLLLWFFL